MNDKGHFHLRGAIFSARDLVSATMQTQNEISIPLELLTDAELKDLHQRALAAGLRQAARDLEKQILARAIRAAVDERIAAKSQRGQRAEKSR